MRSQFKGLWPFLFILLSLGCSTKKTFPEDPGVKTWAESNTESRFQERESSRPQHIVIGPNDSKDKDSISQISPQQYIPPKIERRWVGAQVHGNTLVEAHYEDVIVEGGHWE